jgi:hypothetical protein
MHREEMVSGSWKDTVSDLPSKSCLRRDGDSDLCESMEPMPNQQELHCLIRDSCFVEGADVPQTGVCIQPTRGCGQVLGLGSTGCYSQWLNAHSAEMACGQYYW